MINIEKATIIRMLLLFPITLEPGLFAYCQSQFHRQSGRKVISCIHATLTKKK